MSSLTSSWETLELSMYKIGLGKWEEQFVQVSKEATLNYTPFFHLGSKQDETQNKD